MNLYNLHGNPETLHKHEDRHSNVPELLWAKIKKHHQPTKDELKVIAKDSQMSVEYAQTALNGKRFVQGEPAILKDVQSAQEYAETVIVGRWPEAEEIISKNPNYAYNYANNVIKGRWKKGEEAIATHPLMSVLYASRILKKKWPPGEAAIKKYSASIKLYNEFLKNHDYRDQELLPTNR